MTHVEVPLECPCGHVINRTADLDDPDSLRWATIRDRDYNEVIAKEMRCRDIAPDMNPAEDDPMYKDFYESFFATAKMIGSLHECPLCGRLLWRRAGEEEYTVYDKET